MSITSNLDYKAIIQKAIASLKVRLPVLAAFSTDFGSSVQQKGVSVTVPLIGSKSGGAFSGNYTTDASNSVTSQTVTLDQSTDSVTGLTDLEYADCGLQILEDSLPEDIYAVAKVIVDKALANVTVANYSNEYVKAAASFDLNSVIDLKAQAMALGWDRGTILLNATAYAAFLAEYVDTVVFTPGQDPTTMEFLGFKIMCYPNLPTTETLVGICCNPIAIAVASRPVAIPPNAVAGGTTQSIVTDPDSRISIGVRSYYSDATGRQISAVHQVHGSAVGVAAGLIRIVWSDQIYSSTSSNSSSSSSSSSSTVGQSTSSLAHSSSSSSSTSSEGVTSSSSSSSSSEKHSSSSSTSSEGVTSSSSSSSTIGESTSSLSSDKHSSSSSTVGQSTSSLSSDKHSSSSSTSSNP